VEDFNPAEDRLEVVYTGTTQPVLTVEEQAGVLLVRLDGTVALRMAGVTAAQFDAADVLFTRQAPAA
jgi:hypothetical protein